MYREAAFLKGYFFRAFYKLPGIAKQGVGLVMIISFLLFEFYDYFGRKPYAVNSSFPFNESCGVCIQQAFHPLRHTLQAFFGRE